MVFPSDIRLAFKDLQETNTLAYFALSSIRKNVFLTSTIAKRMMWGKIYKVEIEIKRLIFSFSACITFNKQ
jgi:hypothetical protein